MSNKVLITGFGLITAIGNNAEESLHALMNSKSGIGHIAFLDTIHKDLLPAAEIGHSNKELADIAGQKDYKQYTRSALLGMIAAKEAAIRAGLFPQKPDDLRTGVISATTVGGMDKSEIHYYDYLKSDQYQTYVNTHDCSDSTEKIADLLKAKDYLATISTACSSSANSIIFGAQLIRNNILDRIIVGGTDALSKFTLNGFNSLLILDNQQCKPFDNERKGLNLGEGAGYIVLESEKAAGRKEIYCELRGYANANDAYHQTASSPEGTGAFLSMSEALKKSELTSEDIQYVNAHGTGTENNDLSEGIAIEKIFGQKVPIISSTKPFTGHTLGAAGGIEAVFSIMSIIHQICYPNLNFKNQMTELSFKPINKLIQDIKIQNVLSNSFGFGGNNSSLIFSAC